MPFQQAVIVPCSDCLRSACCFHRTFQFHEVMLALVKMRFGNSCLPFELEIAADEKLRRRTQDTAARLIQCEIVVLLLRPPLPLNVLSSNAYASKCAATGLCTCLGRMSVMAWRMGRTPPAYITGEKERENWATTVSIARFWVMTVAIKKSRISANRLKVSGHRSLALSGCFARPRWLQRRTSII
jgi:hypothetical protein